MPYMFPPNLLSCTMKLEKIISYLKTIAKNRSLTDYTVLFSLTLAVGLITLYSPLTVFSSSPSNFNLTIAQLTIKLLPVSLILFVIGLILYRTIPRAFRGLSVSIISFVAIGGWLYTYLIPGDFGYLDDFMLTDFYVLSRLVRLCELGGICMLFTVYHFLSKRFLKQSLQLIVVLNIMSFAQTASNVMRSDFSTNRRNNVSSANSDIEGSSLFSFSKESNVVVIMLDMFCGGIMPQIMEENEELISSFDGFSWYKNTLTTSVNTFGSMPAIMGGHQYMAEVMNKKKRPLLEQLTEAYAFWGKAPELKDYSVAMTGLAYLNDPKALTNIDYSTRKEIYDYWKNTPVGMKLSCSQDENESLVVNGYPHRTFLAIGLFKFSPFCFKRLIYDNASWLKTNNSCSKFLHTLSNIAVLNLLPSISNTNSDKKTIKIICNELTHLPWTIDDSGMISKEFVENTDMEIASEGYKKSCHNPILPYNSSVKSLSLLSEWFTWMKKCGVYDNTKIIIVSDHGYSGLNPMFTKWKEVYSEDGEYLDGTARIHPLLLVKDFNERGDMKSSDLFMSNADIPALISSAVGGIEGIIEDPIKHPEKERELTINFIPWMPHGNKKDRYKITAQFIVKKDMFNWKNWREVK